MATDPVDPFGGLTGESRDAYAAIMATLNSYDLGSLAPTILGYIKNGYTSDTISVLLPTTDAYKQRFSANTARQAAGLPVLSPAEYLATEQSYRQIMSASGLPAGFYDQPSDFTDLLSKDISPTEVQSRVQAAKTAVDTADQATKDYFSQWYSTGDMIAYALDPTKAATAVETNFKAAQAASVGLRNNLSLDKTSAEQIANTGLNASQIAQGIGQAAGTSTDISRLAAIYGGQYTQKDALAETFFNNGQAQQVHKGLASQERAQFGGSDNTNAKALNRKSGGQV